MLSIKEVKGFIPDDGAYYDVIVVGGGPAGIGAALSSVKNGAKTLLLEGKGFFGGVASTSLWMPMNRLMYQGGNRGGVHDIFVEKIKSYGPDACREGKTSWVDGDGLHIHPDYLRLAVFELLEEAGCDYRLYSPVTGVIIDGDALKGVKVQTKNGVEIFTSKVVVDATGDGDVAYLSGAEMVKGGEDGEFMPVTLGFALANVDVEKLLNFTANKNDEFKTIIENARKEGYCTSIFYSFDRTTIPGVVSVNNGGFIDIGKIDGTSVQDMNLSERTGIQVAVDFIKIARQYMIPGLEQSYLMRTGASVGVRETRRIVGEYVLSEEDVYEGVEFPDIVARRYGQIDFGGLSKNKDYLSKMKSGHAYPYKCMIPKRIDNLLAAGRCGSTTHVAQAAGKSMGNMMELGQAAGVAAALSSKKGIAPRNLDVREVQQVLKSMGVRL